MSASPLPLSALRHAPKVVLHQHLDGSLRPATVLELAQTNGYERLPEHDVDALARWFARASDRGSLPLYLAGFEHTIAVLQSAEALERAAFECLEDLARDGAVYAEIRFAPHFHTQGVAARGVRALDPPDVMRAVLRGLAAAGREHRIGWGLIVCALRNEAPERSLAQAELALAFREQGCVGFDLAGEEDGYPAADHARAFELARRANFSVTIHAGESFGPPSIWQALHHCGAHRIGHGVRLIEDIDLSGAAPRLGSLARYVLDKRVPLEVCLSSNVHTGAVPSLEEHPFRDLLRAGFRVTLSPDNTLMSATDMTNEYALAARAFDCSLDEFERLAINAMKSAFAPWEERVKMIYERVKPGYAALRDELGLPPRAPYGTR
jgi:adenosine deaminase